MNVGSLRVSLVAVTKKFTKQVTSPLAGLRKMLKFDRISGNIFKGFLGANLVMKAAREMKQFVGLVIQSSEEGKQLSNIWKAIPTFIANTIGQSADFRALMATMVEMSVEFAVSLKSWVEGITSFEDGSSNVFSGVITGVTALRKGLIYSKLATDFLKSGFFMLGSIGAYVMRGLVVALEMLLYPIFKLSEMTGLWWDQLEGVQQSLLDTEMDLKSREDLGWLGSIETAKNGIEEAQRALLDADQAHDAWLTRLQAKTFNLRKGVQAGLASQLGSAQQIDINRTAFGVNTGTKAEQKIKSDQLEVTNKLLEKIYRNQQREAAGTTVAVAG